MHRTLCGLAVVVLAAAAAPAVAAEAPPEYSITVPVPKFPNPLVTSILGLSLTAVAAVGARASNRSSDTMMYMVLATLAVTAVMVALSDRLHGTHQRAG